MTKMIGLVKSRMQIGLVLAMLVALTCSLSVALIAAPAARAAPAITLTKDAPATVLHGAEATMTLRASNPAGQPYGYNLSFKDVLPAGVSYVPGSSEVEPTVLSNAPVAGQTTLIFSNVADLSPGSSHELSYKVKHDPAVLTIGQAVSVTDANPANDAGAYINTDPRRVPDFTSLGVASDFTGSANAQAQTLITAIQITKSEPSPEGELLRGAHDHQTVYTLKVKNNGVKQTTGISVEDYLPAGLEFLGCGTADNTTNAPTNPGSALEYPGSGPLNPGNAPATSNCRTPSRVETVNVDPDGAGPLPLAVYTHVVWNGLGTLASGAELEIQYVAAVPIRENTLTWSGTTPSAGSLDQGSNLDNNNGPETVDEQELKNFATAAGSYNGTLAVSDKTYLTRTAEDLAIQKSVDRGTAGSDGAIVPGTVSRWTFDIQTSEYRVTKDLEITDTLPNGLCPLGTQNYEGTGGDGQRPECAPRANPDPASGLPTLPSDDYTAVAEQSDGSYKIDWDKTTVPRLAHVAPSSRLKLTFPTMTRQKYQSNFSDAAPVLTRDSWSNEVRLSGVDFRICAPSDPDCTGSGSKIDGDEVDGVRDLDESSAGQSAGGITIDKTILDPTSTVTPVNCTSGSYIDETTPGYVRPKYAPGDRVCWQLRVNFSGPLFTGLPKLRDFLPRGLTYDTTAPAFATANNTVAATLTPVVAGDTSLEWTLNGGSDVALGSQVFEWRFATVLGKDITQYADDVVGNLMKLSYSNTAGQSFPLRDLVEFEREDANLSLLKGVQSVNGGTPNGPNVDNVTVKDNDNVVYRVDLTNDGTRDAKKTQVWDNLPAGITCTDVNAALISDGGTCAAIPGSLTGAVRITWTNVVVAASSSKKLTYTVKVPVGVEPSRNFDNVAGVVGYVSDTNTGGEFAYVPSGNIDPSAPTANTTPAKDGSRISTKAVTLTKDRTTSVNETGNNATSQATIGETILYTVTATVPEGTTLYGNPVLGDPLGTRQTFVPGTAVATFNGSTTLPAGVTLTTTGNTVKLNFPASYTNAPGSGDDVFVLTFSATVNDIAANKRTGVAADYTLPNTARFDWTDAAATATGVSSPTVTTTIVEPNLKIAKSHLPTGTFKPGETVHYTLNVTNPTITRGSVGHDLQIVDTIPVGLTPTPGTYGTGVWDAGTRTITWTRASLAQNATFALTYDVTVDDPAVAGATFTNNVALTGSSLAGTVTGERTSTSPITDGYKDGKSDVVKLGGASLTKSVTPTTATIGDTATYTVDVVFPSGIKFYDTTVIDTLPDGFAYGSTTSATCIDGCTGTVDASDLPSVNNAGGTTTLGWFVGDLDSQSTPRTFRFVYTARVKKQLNGSVNVKAGDTLTNKALAYYNGSNLITGTPGTIPNPGTFTDKTNEGNATVTVAEPKITLDKDVSDDADDDDRRPTQPGDDYTYSLKVKNTGTSPAYDVDVTDVLDEDRLKDVVLVGGSSYATDSDGSDGTLAWTIPGPIAPGDTVTLTYTAKLAPSSALTDADTVVNTANVPSYWGVVTGNQGNGREYTENPTDTVTLDVALPKLKVVKTTGGTGTPEQANAQVGESFPWKIVISNTSTVATAKKVNISELLPANWSYIADSAAFSRALPSGTDTEPSNTTLGGVSTLGWIDIGDLAPGASVTLTFNAKPNVGALTTPGTGATHLNHNSVTVTGEDVSGATGSKTGDYTSTDGADALLQTPNLTVAKTPDNGNVVAGAGATYSIVINNTGDGPARDVVVTDTLGANQTYAAGAATAVPATGFSETSSTKDDDTGVTTTKWAIASIPAGGKVTISVPITTPAGLAANTTLTNNAAVVSREITTPVTDPGSLTSTVDSDVGIEKTVTSPTANATAGGNIVYQLKATNHGPSDATGVTVSDELPSNVTFVSAPDCTYTAGTRTVSCAVGALANGDDATFALTVKVDSDETVGVDNTATVSSTTPDSNTTNNEDEADKPVSALADLVVTKTASKANLRQGEQFTYTVKVKNQGVSDAVAVSLQDILPAPGITLVSATTDTGTCTPTLNTVNCTIGRLVPDATAEITITATANNVGTFDNTATATTTTTESSTTNNSDSAEVDVAPVANLGIEKTAPATVDANDNLTYTLTLNNDGPSAATGVVVTDVLPDGVEFVSASPGCTEVTGTVTCTVGALPVTNPPTEPKKVLTITVKVPWTSADKTLTNEASIDGNELDLTPTDDSSEVETVVGPAVNLKITKTAPTLPVVQSVEYDYVVTVTNDGPSTAKNVVLADPMPTGVTALRATSADGTCTVTGTPTEVECDLGDMPKDTSKTVTITARGDAPGNPINKAVVSSDTPEIDTDDNEDEAPVEITPAADLGVVKTAPATVAPDGTIGYELAIVNNGPSPATGVEVVDTLPVGVTFTSASAGCVLNARTVTCTVGDLAVDERKTLKINVKAPFALAGQTLTNSATISGNETDLVAPNDSSQATTTVGPGADLSLTKTANGAVAGGKASWTVTVRNSGPTTATGVKVHDVLPAGTRFESVTSSQGTCSNDGGTVDCVLGTLASGGSAQLTIVADVDAGLAGQTLRNTATVKGSEPDPDPTNDTDTADIVVVPSPVVPGPDLQTTKTASTSKPQLGKRFSYTVVVRNAGKGRANQVRLTDTMDRDVRIDAIKPSQGRCTKAGSTIDCDLGALEPGAAVTIKVDVTPIRKGALRNTATAVAVGQTDPVMSDNGAVAGVQVSAPRTTATMTKRASQRSVLGGRTVVFTIKVKMGKKPGANVKVCDRLPAGLVFVRAAGATFRKGQACWTIPYLAAKATKTLKITTRAERSYRARNVSNTAVVTGDNVRRGTAKAPLRIRPAVAGRPGGVTG